MGCSVIKHENSLALGKSGSTKERVLGLYMVDLGLIFYISCGSPTSPGVIPVCRARSDPSVLPGMAQYSPTKKKKKKIPLPLTGFMK